MRKKRVQSHKSWLSIILAALVGLICGNCCSMHLDPDEFTTLPLHTQIQMWQEYRARGCGSEANNWYLDAIAQHEKPAADAMVPFLVTDGSAFPVKDAITIMGLVAAGGVDLRDHPGTVRLRILMTDAPDEWVRKAAWYAVRTIDGVDPPWPT